MHNGAIAEFNTMKRRLQLDLPDVAFDMVQGNTGTFTPSPILCWHLTVILRFQDSEWAFALFLSKVLLKHFDEILYSSQLRSFRIATHDLSPPRLSGRPCWIRSPHWMNMLKNLVSPRYFLYFSGQSIMYTLPLQPSLLNFCVTDGESVVVTRYISSRIDEAASLVRSISFEWFPLTILYSVVFIRHRVQRICWRRSLPNGKGW